MKATTIAALIIAAALLSVSYQIYLSDGCPLDGYMTWHGKECVTQ